MKSIKLALESFDISISKINNSNLDKLTKYQQKISSTLKYLNQFRILLRTNKFPSQKAEIKFFKYQKPHLQGHLLYFQNLKKYYLLQPFGSISKQNRYINQQLADLDSKCCINIEFIKYYRLNETKLDQYLFLRSNNQFDLFIDSTHHFDDPEFSTNHDFLVSQIIANDLLKKFYTNELENLKHISSLESSQASKLSLIKDIPWTGTKTDLVELIFALGSTYALKNGNAELSKIKALFELAFDIELGNIHKIFDQICNREKDQTKFMDVLKTALLQKIDSKLE